MTPEPTVNEAQAAVRVVLCREEGPREGLARRDRGFPTKLCGSGLVAHGTRRGRR